MVVISDDIAFAKLGLLFELDEGAGPYANIIKLISIRQ